jgi:hypothetical protein
MFTSSGNDFARIFRMTRRRWAFTVTSLMPSSPPNCLFSLLVLDHSSRE